MDASQLSKWFDWIRFSDIEYLDKLLGSLLILFFLWVLRYSILKIVEHQTNNINTRYFWRKGTRYLLIFLLIILVGRHWLNGLEPILAFLGIIAVGLTISLKDMVSNVAGIVVIMWRNTFVVGDRIEIAGHKGDVVGLGIMYFTVLEIGQWVDAEQSTGRLIKIPNSLVLSQPIINYTKSFPFVWDEISICVTFDSDWKKAREVLQTLANETVGEKSRVAEEELKQVHDEMIQFHHLSPKVYLKPANKSPAGIVLTLRYLCEPRQRRDLENNLWEAILDRFQSDPSITIAQ